MNLLKNSFSSSGLFGKLILLVFFVFFGMIMAGGLSVIGEKMHWINIQNTNDLLIVQAVTTILMFVVPAFALAYLCSENIFDFLFLNKKSQFFEITAVVGILIIAMPFINLMTSVNESLEKIPLMKELFGSAQNHQQELADKMISGNFWGALAVVAFLAATAEELMFRGAVLRIFSEKINLHAAVWLSATVFGLIHFQFFGLLPRIVLGAYFAYIVMFSKNLRLPIWAHLFNNAAIIIVQHFAKNQTNNKMLDTFGGGGTCIAGIISGILAVFATIYLLKYWKKNW